MIKSQKGGVGVSKRKLMVLRILSWAAVAICMAVIFLLSAETAEESSKLSESVSQQAVKEAQKKINQTYKTKSERHRKLAAFKRDVRSYAHIAEFTILGVLLMLAFETVMLRQYLRVILAVAVGVIYGVSDEIHQLFVDGRTFQMNDILFDALGVTVGVAVTFGAVLLIGHIIKKHKAKAANKI